MDDPNRDLIGRSWQGEDGQTYTVGSTCSWSSQYVNVTSDYDQEPILKPAAVVRRHLELALLLPQPRRRKRWCVCCTPPQPWPHQ